MSAVIGPEYERESYQHRQEHLKAQDKAGWHGTVLSPRAYLLQLRHMLPPVEEFKCSKFMLLVSVEPMVAGGEADAAAQGGDGSSCAGVTESKWPQISEDLTDLFACQGTGGDADFRCWQDLHGMRSVSTDVPARHRLVITLDKTSHLRVEIGYPLYSWPLMTSVLPLACPDGAGPCSSSEAEGQEQIAPVVSRDRPGSSLLVARWLPPGRYLITLAQQALMPAAAQDMFEERSLGAIGDEHGRGNASTVCQRFSFRLMLEKAQGSSSANHLGQHVQQLPASLNGVPFLKFGGRAHLYGRFALSHPGLASENMVFTLRTPSEIKVDAMAQQGAGDVTLALFRVGDEAAEDGTLGSKAPMELRPLNDALPPALLVYTHTHTHTHTCIIYIYNI